MKIPEFFLTMQSKFDKKLIDEVEKKTKLLNKDEINQILYKIWNTGINMKTAIKILKRVLKKIEGK